MDKVYNKDKTGEGEKEHEKERVNLNPKNKQTYQPPKDPNPPKDSNKGAKKQRVVGVSRWVRVFP